MASARSCAAARVGSHELPGGSEEARVSLLLPRNREASNRSQATLFQADSEAIWVRDTSGHGRTEHVVAGERGHVARGSPHQLASGSGASPPGQRSRARQDASRGAAQPATLWFGPSLQPLIQQLYEVRNALEGFIETVQGARASYQQTALLGKRRCSSRCRSRSSTALPARHVHDPGGRKCLDDRRNATAPERTSRARRHGCRPIGHEDTSAGPSRSAARQ